jgi:hypothetical protein
MAPSTPGSARVRCSRTGRGRGKRKRKELVKPPDNRRCVGAPPTSSTVAPPAQFPHSSSGPLPKRVAAPRFDVADKPRQVANQADRKQRAGAAIESLGLALGGASYLTPPTRAVAPACSGDASR